jgi:uncharacterized membrane protein
MFASAIDRSLSNAPELSRMTLTSKLRACAVLALCGASLVLFGWQLLDEHSLAFARTDLFPPGTRVRLLLAVGAGATLVPLAAIAYVATRSVGGCTIGRIARIAAPMAVLGWVPALCVPGLWPALPTVLGIAAIVLVLERLLRVSLSELGELVGSPSIPAPRPSRARLSLGLAAIVAASAFYAIYMSVFTIYMHRRFATFGYDLGQYDNVFWSTLHGHPLRCSPLNLVFDWQDIGNHADLSVFFLIPFYAIRPNAETLLVMQACILGLGAIPLYLFAARRLPTFYACALAIGYLLYPPLHGSNFYDFHFQPVAATVVLWTIYLVDAKRWIPAALMFVVGLGCREDTSVGLAMLGLYLFLSGYRPRAGAVMAVVASIYFVVIKFVIMPHYWSSWFSEIYSGFYPRPDGSRSFAGIVETLATNPIYVFRTLLTEDKLRYFLQIIAPVAFLPLRRASLLPALAPGTLFTLLTTGYAPTIDIGFQYSGHFTPYIFAASALALASYRSDRNGNVRSRAAVAAMMAGTLLCTLQWGAFPPRGIKGGFIQVSFLRPTPEDQQKARDLADLWAMIPETATYAVSEQEMPHVSGSLKIHSLRDGTSEADYLLYGPRSFGGDVGARALAEGKYVELALRPGLVLLKRKEAAP